MGTTDSIAANLPLPRRRVILGVRVDDVTWNEALARIAGFVASNEPHQVMTPNPEFVMRARRDPVFRALLARVDMAPPDGVGLMWAAKLLGVPLRALVPGSDLVERLATVAGNGGQRWFLLGAAEGVAAAAAAALQQRCPGLEIAGVWSGTPDPADDEEICRRIAAAAPIHVLLVAYGAPQQDLWIARNQPRLRVPVAIGVGGTFDVLAGQSRRPPALVKWLRCIWLFRLIVEPWRWRRQLALMRFALLVLYAAMRRPLQASRPRRARDVPVMPEAEDQ